MTITFSRSEIDFFNFRPNKYIEAWHTCQLSILGEELLWTGPEQNHAVNHTTLWQPVYVSLLLDPPRWRCLVILGEVKGFLSGSECVVWLNLDWTISPLMFQQWNNNNWNNGYLMIRWAVVNVHIRLGCVQPEQTQSPVGLVGNQQRHRPVQAKATVHVVGEDIQVIQPIRFSISVKWDQ